MKIYLLYVCDQWKSKDSMRLLMASTKKTAIVRQIHEEVRQNNMEFTFDVSRINTQNPTEYNDILTYGYVEVVNDGELL